MFHDHREDKFLVDRDTLASTERDAIKSWDIYLPRRTAGVERSREIRTLIGRVAHYLGDLAESRHSPL